MYLVHFLIVYHFYFVKFHMHILHCQFDIDIIRSNSVGCAATSLSPFDPLIGCYVASAVAVKQAGSNKKNRSGACSIYNIFQYLVHTVTSILIQSCSMHHHHSDTIKYVKSINKYVNDINVYKTITKIFN